jgi:hypothetical protein
MYKNEHAGRVTRVFFYPALKIKENIISTASSFWRAKKITYLHDSIYISVSMICIKIHAECSWGVCCGVTHMCVCACGTIPGPLLAGMGI